MVDYYYDVNDQVYFADREFNLNITQNTGRGLAIGLGDLPELPGQSSLFINKVRFQFEGWGNTGGVAYSYGHMVAGVIPKDLAVNDFKYLQDFQDFMAWPMGRNGVGYRYYLSHSNNGGNSADKINLVYTYTPKKALLLNREQDLMVGIFNDAGTNIGGLLSIVVQAKRAN